MPPPLPETLPVSVVLVRVTVPELANSAPPDSAVLLLITALEMVTLAPPVTDNAPPWTASLPVSTKPESSTVPGAVSWKSPLGLP